MIELKVTPWGRGLGQAHHGGVASGRHTSARQVEVVLPSAGPTGRWSDLAHGFQTCHLGPRFPGEPV